MARQQLPATFHPFNSSPFQHFRAVRAESGWDKAGMRLGYWAVAVKQNRNAVEVKTGMVKGGESVRKSLY